MFGRIVFRENAERTITRQVLSRFLRVAVYERENIAGFKSQTSVFTIMLQRGVPVGGELGWKAAQQFFEADHMVSHEDSGLDDWASELVVAALSVP